jgi:hypothetical protein
VTPGTRIAKTTLGEYTEQCQQALAAVEYCRANGPGEPVRLITGLGQLRDWARFMLLHEWLRERLAPWKALSKAVENPEWLLALLEYLCRTGRMTPGAAVEVLEGRAWYQPVHLRFVTSGMAIKERQTDAATRARS